MSRRQRRRMRPATEAEQEQVRRFAEATDAALTAGSTADRRRALTRMRRAADRLADPGNLSGLTAAELVDALAEQRPETPHQTPVMHQKANYGVAEQGGRSAQQ